MATAGQTAKSVLLIEDNFIACERLATVLRRHGYDAVTATDGGMALAMLTGGTSPDLILLDMLMPHVDGWRFLDRVRGRAVPVVVMTGADLTREWAELRGCAGFLKKPFDEADLLAEVRRCLDR